MFRLTNDLYKTSCCVVQKGDKYVWFEDKIFVATVLKPEDKKIFFFVM